MARVYSFAELSVKIKTLRDLTNTMLRDLKAVQKYYKLLVDSDEESYTNMSAALDARIAGLDYMRDDIYDRVGLLVVTLWSREIETYPDSANLLQSSAITIAGTNDIAFTNMSITNIFQNADQFEIVAAENPDHLGIYTISSSSSTQIYFTPTPTTGDVMAVTSITRSSSTATCNTTAVHGLVTGDYVVISGATQTEYNGTFQVTVVDTDTFTYTVSGTPATPATGTPVVYKAAASNAADTSLKLRLYAR